MQTISAMKIRKNLGEILAKVELRGEEFIIEKAGKPSAVIMPYAKAQKIKQQEAKRALRILRQQARKKPNRDLSDEDLEQFVHEALHESRKLR